MSGRVRAGVARFGGLHDKRHARTENHLFDKTRLCSFFAKGRCARGPSCTFAHSVEELEVRPDLYRTQFCFAFLRSGTCPFGSACSFAHSRQELQRPALDASRGAGGVPQRGAELEAFCEEARQLDLMQQQVARLREQMRELEVLREGRRAFAKGAAGSSSGCSSGDEEFAGLGCAAAVRLSRQTTGEGEDSDGSASAPFSRGPSSSADEDTWEELGGTAEAAEAAEPCTLVVRRTFFSLEPLHAEGPCRRSKSAAAAIARWRGGAAGKALA